MKHLRSILIFLSFFLLTSFLVPAVTYADTTTGGRIECGQKNADGTLTPGSELLLGCSGTDTSDPGGIFFRKIIPKMISWVIGVLGIIAFFFFVEAGFVLITSQGNVEKFKSAQKTAIAAAIGLVLAISSYILVSIAASFSLT